MDWSEIVQRMVVLAGAEGPPTFAELNELVPPKVKTEDIEQLIENLNARGIWITEE